MDQYLYISPKSLFRDDNIRRQLHTPYLDACRFFGCALVDRTQTLHSGIHFKIVDALCGSEGFGTDNLPRTEKTFATICEEQAKAIISQAEEKDKPIRVLWSGGIDSTTVLVALIQALEGNLKNRVELDVLLSQESIDEYPLFFKRFIENKLKYTLFKAPIGPWISDRYITVTGEHGDQLFGSDKAKNAILSGNAFRPVMNVLPHIISRKLGCSTRADTVIEFLAPQIAQCPIPVNTLYDYLWWMNFSMKWQNVAYRLIANAGLPPASLDTTIFHFFKHRDFQRWSISNPEAKISSDWTSYKYLAKKYIYEYCKDKEYLANKEKEPSLKNTLFSRSLFSATPKVSRTPIITA